NPKREQTQASIHAFVSHSTQNGNKLRKIENKHQAKSSQNHIHTKSILSSHMKECA
ncbi:hypothetical protein CGSMWGv1400E_01537, partial [Gardnerella vaginalis 1400E]